MRYIRTSSRPVATLLLAMGCAEPTYPSFGSANDEPPRPETPATWDEVSRGAVDAWTGVLDALVWPDVLRGYAESMACLALEEQDGRVSIEADCDGFAVGSVEHSEVMASFAELTIFNDDASFQLDGTLHRVGTTIEIDNLTVARQGTRPSGVTIPEGRLTGVLWNGTCTEVTYSAEAEISSMAWTLDAQLPDSGVLEMRVAGALGEVTITLDNGEASWAASDGEQGTFSLL